MTSEPGAGGSAGEAGEDEPRRGYNWKRHLPRLVLLGGLALAAVVVAPTIPRDQTLVFRLGEEVQPVRRLEATWTRYGQDEPTGGVTLTFPDHAPRLVRHQLHVPNGQYVLAIVLERAAPETTSRERANLRGEHTARIRYVRRVDLEGGKTIVPLWQEN